MVYLYHNIWIVRINILIKTKTHKKENGSMDEIKYVIFTDKSIQLLKKINIFLISNQDQLGQKKGNKWVL